MNQPVIPGYQIEATLGRGASSQVFAAIRLADQRPVALKVIFETRGGEMRARAEQEALLCWAIDHPNVVRILGWGGHPDGLYIAMERLAGDPLDRALDQRGRLSVGETLQIARQVCRGLAAIHAHDAVHRDIKPANLFLADWDSAPRVKILDLGVARLAPDDPARRHDTELGLTVGTPGYMPPEQARAEQMDDRTDLFALGITLFECLTGRRPVEETTARSTALAMLRMQALPPLPDDVPEPLDRLIRQLTDPDPQLRPADAYAALDALAEVETGGQAQTTVFVGGSTLALGDLSLPQLGQWSGHQRFRDHLVVAIARAFRSGDVPQAIAVGMAHAEELEGQIQAATSRARIAVATAGRRSRERAETLGPLLAHDRVLAAEQAERREAFVAATVAVDRAAEALREVDAAYGRTYATLDRGLGADLGTLFGAAFRLTFRQLDTLEARRVAALAQLNACRQKQDATRAAVADADCRRARFAAELKATEAEALAAVETAELQARREESELLRLEQACEHTYLRLGLELQAALSGHTPD